MTKRRITKEQFRITGIDESAIKPFVMKNSDYLSSKTELVSLARFDYVCEIKAKPNLDVAFEDNHQEKKADIKV